MGEGGEILSLSKREENRSIPGTMANYVYFKFLASSLDGINGQKRNWNWNGPTSHTMRQRRR